MGLILTYLTPFDPHLSSGMYLNYTPFAVRWRILFYLFEGFSGVKGVLMFGPSCDRKKDTNVTNANLDTSKALLAFDISMTYEPTAIVWSVFWRRTRWLYCYFYFILWRRTLICQLWPLCAPPSFTTPSSPLYFHIANTLPLCLFPALMKLCGVETPQQWLTYRPLSALCNQLKDTSN